MDFLGSTKLVSAAVTTGVVTISARDILCVLVRVTGYSSGDIASLRFNADSGANYWSKGSSAGTTATSITAVTAATSVTLAKMFAANATQGRSAVVSITNNATTEKIGAISGATGSGTAGTGGILECNSFGWVNTTAQITSIEMRTFNGVVTLSSGSGFAVFGRNF
jgi:hypothetical protein